MKESVGTLRVYLGLVGCFNGVSSASTLLSSATAVFTKLLALFYLAVSLAVLYVAVALPKLLRDRGPLLVGIFRAYAVIAALSAALVLTGVLFGAMSGQPTPDGKPIWLTVMPSLLGLAIAVYLSRNIVRLVGEFRGASAASSE